MKFTYSSGQRPLDGYTIKRGVGRGGFGEVYYGVSDGGKEVALKLVCSNLDVELRGISQCLNFKHPNLVNLYDLKTDDRGKGQLAFYLSDSVTSFRVLAEGVTRGGLPGRGESLVQSKLPVSLAVKLPVEVSSGDAIRLPITVVNETSRPYRASLRSSFGPAFKVQGDVPTDVALKPSERTEEAFFTSYSRGRRCVSFYGDNHPHYAGSVVKAMASAKHGFLHVAALFPELSELAPEVLK